MIQLIYGKKGSGKSKKLLNMANEEVAGATGNIVYIDDDNRIMYNLKHEVRFINTSEYGIDNADSLYGFVSGILSGDFDISSIYIDGLKKMIKKDSGELESLLAKLDKVFGSVTANMVISSSADLPEYLNKYTIIQ